jgi:drug/metabolite transporter, DME family
MSPLRRRVLGSLAVVAAAVCFGTLGPVSRFAYEQGQGPLGFVAWRALLAIPILLAFVALRLLAGTRLVRLRGLPSRDRSLLLVAAGALTGTNLAIFLAFERLTIALALLLFYLFPAIVALASAALGWERLDRLRVAALLLAMLGVALVLVGQLDAAGGLRLDLLGIVAGLAAALCQATYILAGRSGYRQVPAEQAVTFFVVTAAVVYLGLALLAGAAADVTLPFSKASLWPLLLWAGAAGAAVPTLLFLLGVRSIGGTRTAILAMTEPVVGVLLAAALLSEGLAPIQLVGAVLVIVAGILLQREHEPTSEVAPGPG